MRLAFAGTPRFAAAALASICDAGFEVALVLTQPDRPAGRGMKLQASEVKLLAQARGLPVLQPGSLRLDGPLAGQAQACRDALRAASVDALVVAAYGLILPRWVLDDLASPHADGRRRHGCLNIHASLLPRWRGAAPIQRAIEAGDASTGVCIMQMDEGLDTGDILLRADAPIRHEEPEADTSASLHDRLSALGARLIVQALQLAEQGRLQRTPQPLEGACYARKIERLQARLDWAMDAHALHRRIRAFDPAPGAWTTLNGAVLKVWQAAPTGQPAPAEARPGQVLAIGPQGVDLATGGGVLRLHAVQSAGARRIGAAAFAHGHGLQVGMCLGEGPAS